MTRTANRSAAEILREYGPFPGFDKVGGVSFDGRHIWVALGDVLNAIDPDSGKTVRTLPVAAHAGTAFDGQHLFQIAESRIQKVDPQTGKVLATIPRLAAVATPASPGRKARSGSANIAIARFIRSTLKPVSSCVP